MMGSIANVVLDALMVGLLTATIIYCYVLNRRIKVLQDSKSELASLLQRFDESTVKASETIVAMQTASKKIGDNIQSRIDKANYLLDDLAYSIDKGGRLVNQLEASFAIHRARSRADHDGVEAPVMLAEAAEEGEAIAERGGDKNGKAASRRTPASIEAIVDKVVSRKSPATTSAPVSRSRAEQELIELIRSSKG